MVLRKDGRGYSSTGYGLCHHSHGPGFGIRVEGSQFWVQAIGIWSRVQGLGAWGGGLSMSTRFLQKGITTLYIISVLHGPLCPTSPKTSAPKSYHLFPYSLLTLRKSKAGWRLRPRTSPRLPQAADVAQSRMIPCLAT